MGNLIHRDNVAAVAATVVAREYSVGDVTGDRRGKITATSANITWAGGAMDRILQDVLNTWVSAPGALDATHEMLFTFAEAINPQEFIWEQNAVTAMGVWTVAVEREASFTDLAATKALGGALRTIIAIDAALQTNVTAIRFRGFSGSMSNVPFITGVRVIGTVVPV